MSKHDTDQWVQKQGSVDLVALWIRCAAWYDMEDNTEVQLVWDPLLEQNPMSRVGGWSSWDVVSGQNEASATVPAVPGMPAPPVVAPPNSLPPPEVHPPGAPAADGAGVNGARWPCWVCGGSHTHDNTVCPLSSSAVDARQRQGAPGASSSSQAWGPYADRVENATIRRQREQRWQLE